MEEIRSYILSVTAAAVLCAMVSTLAGKSGNLSALVKLMSGVVLACVVISPVAKISAIDLSRYLDGLNLDAMAAVEAGTDYTKTQTSGLITEALEAYILDKAEELSLDISVELTLDDETMLPSAVRIAGDASPHARSVLEQTLGDDLEIPLEAVTWN